MKKYLILIPLFLCLATSAFAQFDSQTCETLLKPYTKANKDFVKMNIATLDFTKHHQKFDINWLTDLKFNYLDKVLDVEYSTDKGTFHLYIPYIELIKINTSKSSVDLIVKG
ncbi:MAG: hypothetical protein ACI976_000669 [Aureispira sp.]|jgi:hypothetical protein